MTDETTYDLVKIKNIGERPFKWQWGWKRWIEFQPGEVKIVPLEILDVLLGQPGLTGTDRAQKFKVLCNNYGCFDDTDKWDEVRPPLKAKTIDDIDIVTVADDPSGDSVTQADTTVTEKAELESHIQTLQRQMASLQARLETQIRSEHAGSIEDIQEDEPSKVAVGPRRGRER